ncbi:hypothetical protein PNOK_0186500 [Pyrrhoderma noxium]|uniref:Uncharacterized protein n=1 Tax=Pyrrhoderma noxium TaxID=2282107 RepID=A0A286UQN1_9AGAM|nr:hypothetical protein PNOK_0186500 [Pyrrhoderma noxium]
MATVTATISSTASSSKASPFNPRPQKRHAPVRSSPLASAVPASASPSSPLNSKFPLNGISAKPAPQRAHSFPTSRPLRPFASIAPSSVPKPIKEFELPEAFKSVFFFCFWTFRFMNGFYSFYFSH